MIGATWDSSHSMDQNFVVLSVDETSLRLGSSWTVHGSTPGTKPETAPSWDHAMVGIGSSRTRFLVGGSKCFLRSDSHGNGTLIHL